MTESLPDPVDRPSVICQGLCALDTSGNDKGVEQSAALSFVMMVGPHAALTGPDDSASRIHPPSTRTDNPASSRRSFDRSTKSLHLGKIETVRDENSDSARFYGRFLWRVVGLGQSRRGLTVVFPRGLLWNDAANVDSNLFREVEIDVVQQFGVSLKDDGVVAVRELEGECGDEMFLLVLRERVEEELSLVEVLLELCTADSLLDTGNLLGMPGSCLRYQGALA